MRKRGSETIMVVDDDPLMLEMVTDTLEPLGYRVIAAGNGAEAMHRAESESEAIDLLLTDVLMPEMNGLELAERFQGRYPEAKVLFMSGFICPSTAHQNRPLSESAFVQKPFTSNTLIHKMRNVLQGA